MDLFNLIFDESVPVSEQLFKLQDRDDVEKFCKKARIRAAGGEKAVKERLRLRLAAYSAGHTAMAEGRVEDAYTHFMEVSSIIGGLNHELLHIVAYIHFTMKRYKEAAALTYTGRHNFRRKDTDDKLFSAAYYHLGFAAGLGSYAWEPKQNIPKSASAVLRQLDSDDFNNTLESILNLDGSTSWDENLFLVTHANVHFQYGDTAKIISVVKSRSDFIPRITSNPTLMSLISKANFLTSTIAELRFLAWFMRLIASMLLEPLGGNPQFERQLLKEQWYTSFIENFGRSLLSKKGAEKLASAEPFVFEDLYSGWIIFMSPFVKPIAMTEKVMKKWPSYIADMELCCNGLCMVVFSGIHYDSSDPFARNGLSDYPSFFNHILRRMVDSPQLKTCAVAMTAEKFRKTMDEMLALCALSFAEWKLTLMKSPHCLKQQPSKTLTNDEISTELIRFLNYLFIEQQNLSIDHLFADVSLIYYLVDRFSFLASHIELLDDEGLEHFSETLFVFTAAFANASIDKLRAFSENIAFCRRLMAAIGNGFPYFLARPKNKWIEKGSCNVTVLFAARLISFSSTSPCFELFQTNDALPFVKFILDYGCQCEYVNVRAVATVFLAGSNENRQKWASEFSGSLRRIGSYLVDLILKPSRQTIEFSINAVLAFCSMLDSPVPLLPIDAVFGSEQNRKPLLKGLVNAIRLYKAIEKLPPVTALGIHDDIYLKIFALSAGRLLAFLSKEDPVFRKLLIHSNASVHHEVIENLRGVLRDFASKKTNYVFF